MLSVWWFASARFPSCVGVLRASAVACATSGGRGSADPLASFVPGYCEWWWRRCGAAAAWEGGVMVEDLATSVEVEWHRPRIWGGGCLGVVPGRWIFFDFRSSSSELVVSAALQRLRARVSSVPWRTASGGCVLRRLWRWRSRVLEGPEVEDGVTQRWRSLYSPCFFFACICSCNVPFLVGGVPLLYLAFRVRAPWAEKKKKGVGAERASSRPE